MVDPNKLKDFLQRTSDALKRSMDSGDAEGTNKYSQMLDRAMPLAEKVSQQPQQLPAAQPQAAPEPVISWGAKPAEMPAAPEQAPTQVPHSSVMANPFVMPNQNKAALLTMPGGQATPQTSKGPTPPPAQNVGPAMQPGQNQGIAAGMGFGIPGGEEAPAAILKGAGNLLDLPGKLFGGDKKQAEQLDLPSAPQSKLDTSVFEREGELSDGPVDFPATRFEPELAEMMAEPADDVEAMALKRIKTEMADKRHPLMYLFTLLFLGAPRTFQMIMSDQSRHEEGVQRIYAQVRDEIAKKGARATAEKYRARELAATEDNAKANMLRALKAGTQKGEDPADKAAGRVINSPAGLNPNDPLTIEARKRLMQQLKPPAPDIQVAR